MALLTGSLQAFRVQEVLGLVGHKPGQWLLTLQGQHRGWVGLRDGSVVSVSADESRQDLARRLVIEGAVGTTSLAEALRTAGDKGIVRTLVEADLVDPEMLPRIAREHVVSALATLTHWHSGTFSAQNVPALPDDVGEAFPLARMGSDITALLKKWRPASDLLGGPRTVISAYPGPVPDHLRGLYSLIDGHRSVGELIEASGHGMVGTVVDLADLVEARCAVPAVGTESVVEQRLAMLSVLEEPTGKATPRAVPQLAVIHGGAAADDEQEMGPAPAGEEAQDLLTTILRGVRGV